MEGSRVIEPQVVHVREHEKIAVEHWHLLDDSGSIFKITDYESVPEYLGVYDHTASYYIGASWLADNRSAIVVSPKIDNVDFLEMFVYALRYAPTDGYFDKFYDIDLSSRPIKAESLSNVLSPLIVAHFLTTLGRLLKHDLRKGYVLMEENLKSKIKGRIQVSKNLKKNIFTNQLDRNYCSFQEYTVDIPENRILKKALVFSERLMLTMNESGGRSPISDMLSMTRRYLGHFSSVSADIDANAVKRIKRNKLFKEYDDAIRLASLILKRYDYSISKVSEKRNDTPPFWIDMSRLYEVYVYGKLIEAYGEQTIGFQIKGHCRSQVDFIKRDERLIMDAKYKPRYEDSNSGVLSDIREISGYARDSKILNKLGVSMNSSEEVNCVIIYPVLQGITRDEDTGEECADNCKALSTIDKTKDVLSQAAEISWFRNFYKMCLPLPTLL